jgi:hypothetical protein
VGTPGNAGPWNKVSHPRGERRGGNRPGSSKNIVTKTLLTQTTHPEKIEYKICIKVNSSKEKVKTKLFPMDSVSELNTKNLGNSPRFLTITPTTPSMKQFRSYDILKFEIIAKFCFWTEQWLNKTQVLGLGLTETVRGNITRVP